jgi:hypothetical protein
MSEMPGISEHAQKPRGVSDELAVVLPLQLAAVLAAFQLHVRHSQII